MVKSPSGLSRREFSLSLGAVPFASLLAEDDWTAAMPWNQPAVVAKVYLATPHVHWPKPTLDVEKEAAEIDARLKEVEKRHAGDVRMIGGETLRTQEEVRPWLARMGDVDGLLLIPLSQPTTPLRPLLEESHVPVLFFSRPYATHSWGSIADLRKRGRKIDVVASSNFGDLDPYLRMFRTVHHLRRSKVLVGAASPAGRQTAADDYSKQFGTTFQFLTGAEFKNAFNAVDERQAQKEAEEFTRGALRVVEPGAREIHNGLKFYLALREMLKREKANALTIDCFGTLAANTLPGYPCIAWSKFNDAGLYGVCEGDLASTMTQLLITSYSRMPGFVSDPVFDVSRNEVTHAHCVAATKMKGIDGPASPYIVRNHLETNEGAALQVLMPAGETVTVGRFYGPSKFLISTAEVVGPVDSDRGCRSQIRTRVGDAEKWLQNYTAGLHRVVFYGNHVRTVERMGRLMGFEVIEEM